MGHTIYSDDLEIARRLILRDEQLTKEYFYRQCYPLFKSIFDHFYTDCESCKEFINQMYVVVLVPGKKTGRCQMENFKGESTLTRWLKSACLYYCFRRYKKKTQFPTISIDEEAENNPSGDILRKQNISIEPTLQTIDRSDMEALIKLMPNTRYQQIMKYIYIEHVPKKDAAILLGMTASNFYNKHALAKKQFTKVLEEEEKRHA